MDIRWKDTAVWLLQIELFFLLMLAAFGLALGQIFLLVLVIKAIIPGA